MSNNKKVVVTGGCGFIGSAVVKQLLMRNFDVLVIDNVLLDSAAVIPDLRRVRLLRADITDLDKTLISDFYNASWVHLAALPYIPESFKHPFDIFRNNVVGTLIACELAKQTSAERFVFTSSAEVYKSASGRERLAEDATLDPLSPYANSKLAAESIVSSFFSSKDQKRPPFVVLRLFNAYGPNATHPYFIPEMIRQCLKEKEIRVGNLNTLRDFTYVMDTAEAIVLAIEKEGIEGNTFNISSGEQRQMGQVLEMIRELTNAVHKRVIVDSFRVRPSDRDPERLVANSEKAKSVLGWHRTMPFDKGLRQTITEYLQSRCWPYEAVR